MYPHLTAYLSEKLVVVQLAAGGVDCSESFRMSTRIFSFYICAGNNTINNHRELDLSAWCHVCRTVYSWAGRMRKYRLGYCLVKNLWTLNSRSQHKPGARHHRAKDLVESPELRVSRTQGLGLCPWESRGLSLLIRGFQARP